MVYMLMTGENKVNGNVTRGFQFLDEKSIINEKIEKQNNCKSAKHIGKSKAIHVASNGYFVSQNYKNNTRRLVEFRNV